VRWVRYLFECVYVGIPIALAIMGNKHEYAGWFFAALAVTLPCGIAGFIGIYGGYALVKGVGGIFASTTTAAGEDAIWLSTTLDVIRVTAFAAAAVVNVLLLEIWLRRRAAKSEPSLAIMPPGT
jgi:hypothetical protein